VNFFFDNNLAAKIAHGLNEMVAPDHRVIHLRDKFEAARPKSLAQWATENLDRAAQYEPT